MLGDVAVAVHPDDPRYKEFIGMELIHPFIADRSMKIIADPVLVDMNYGTGAVKITPAHDHNDMACGKRHNLEFITVIDKWGKINGRGGKFAGMPRYEARNAIYEALKEMGQVGEKHPNPMRLGRCSKSHDILEPLLLPQWYVDCKDMAKRSADAVRNKELVILPEEGRGE
jgi:valyl-tRNA synthetase